jgi:hypothetical protein
MFARDRAHPDGGCYGLCYAARSASRRGIAFEESVSRRVRSFRTRMLVEVAVANHSASWFRVGTMGDPCHDWPWTIEVVEWLGTFRTPIVITKHWAPLRDAEIDALRGARAIVNTSISPLDSEEERTYRLSEYRRLREAGVRSVLRIVSCRFGETEFGRERSEVQEALFREPATIDNPLRIPRSDPRVLRGDVLVERRSDLGGGSWVSVARESAFVGLCRDCPDQCGEALV